MTHRRGTVVPISIDQLDRWQEAVMNAQALTLRSARLHAELAQAAEDMERVRKLRFLEQRSSVGADEAA